MINATRSTSVILLMLASCNPPETKNSDIPHAEPAPVKNRSECYIGTTTKDTVLLDIFPEGDVVTGELTYQYAEKDKNTGVVKGYYRGDTLLLDYTFNSEGIQSVREIIFLKTERGLAEGYGDMIDSGGKMVFDMNTSIDFSSSLLLKRVNCD